MLQAVYDRSKKDNMTLDQAKETGEDLLRRMRYGDDGKGYFWADTVDGVKIVQINLNAIKVISNGKEKIIPVNN